MTDDMHAVNGDYDKDFFAFCYDQYKIELSDADGIYQKISVLLGVIVILGSVSVKLSPLDLLIKWNDTPFNFLFALFVVLDAALLVVSIVFLFRIAHPHDYERVSPAEKWKEWKERHAAYMASEGAAIAPSPPAMAREFWKSLLSALTVAQLKNFEVNRRRSRDYQNAVRSTMLAATSAFFLALFRLFLYLGG